ncbi:interferon-induced GTP-binding protein Mx1 [Xylariales sp. AK1849]|nr:interferon-induced GTP-binding protein Mx1 [Xylariales sp. AK1849]
MGNLFAEDRINDHGNLTTLTKVDKLRELIGTRISLPQLVVVGDQSSGKSSVLEGITGFAFPRAAELCTRYCTQITCRREEQRSITITILPNEDVDPVERANMQKFHETLNEITHDNLGGIFKKANEAMGLRSGASTGKSEEAARPAFSENILKIEICGPDQEHFTVIDVPGIFRRETAGLTTEHDIELVRKMVQNCMKNERTIILAIIPSNVDPATQEILKLAKKFDPNMTRTMGVLTKPDLNIERTTQKIAIDLVTGKRSDLTLGYYIVKNRGSDDVNKTLQQGQQDEQQFFAREPWSDLRSTGRAGITALKTRVRELLTELLKKEFPKLKLEVARELSDLRHHRDEMGISRSSPHAQRAFLSSMCDRFQAITQNGLNADYTSNDSLFKDQSLRLITQIAEWNEVFSTNVWKKGHTRPFATKSGGSVSHKESTEDGQLLGPQQDSDEAKSPSSNSRVSDAGASELVSSPYDEELGDILELSGSSYIPSSGSQDIMSYIGSVYDDSRGLDLGTFGGKLLATMFKEQSQNWETMALDYVSQSILVVHHFIRRTLCTVCPDEHVRQELWNDHLLEALRKAYSRAMDHTRFLLTIERQGRPYTLNHYFNDNLQKARSDRLSAALEQLGQRTGEEGIHLSQKQLYNISISMANSDHVREDIHDVLKSYYKVSRKRFVDVVFQQAVDHFLLIGGESPLYIFTSGLVLGLNDEQLEMIAGESASVKAQRVKLDRDIANFGEAWKVLKGSK